MILIFSDGSEHRVINQFMIAAHKTKYLKMDARFVDDDQTIMAPVGNVCDDCRKEFSSLPFPTPFFSEDTSLNKRLNRPARICAICYYRPYYESGHIIPTPLAPFF